MSETFPAALYAGINFLQGSASFNANQRPLMNIAERTPSEEEILLRNNDKLSREIRCAIPAQVISFNPEHQTIVAQPLIREKIINRQNGQVGFVTLPQLVDIPVCFPQAGNFVLTMPIQAGDEVLLVFSDTCIDSWWQSGGIQNWNDRRRHDLSDAIAVVGINSVPKVIPEISATGTELRTKSGNAKVAVEKQSILFNDVETPFDAITIRVGTSSIIFGKTIEIVEGVPILIDTINITSPRLIINGVG